MVTADLVICAEGAMVTGRQRICTGGAMATGRQRICTSGAMATGRKAICATNLVTAAADLVKRATNGVMVRKNRVSKKKRTRSNTSTGCDRHILG
jgi:hypothetical protein